ncbi:ABC transporter substrate-binding protein [Microbacterium sp. SORGH_AS_0888]|uniref:ABC transporter substrate-binding protein n=1 Tax=Microbacterium sp. SORGH_AS_0888 TaxID=3041791 RepID=UPI002781C5FA|nr:ABC transporter substrate-binding protein [Microbacterium sp. SORGH_AS_0888]MDQ1130877.1 branched-chain amino acid transport system substrate-binding protein [Microbacterium sp. SORGH_AS_0888]
MKITHTSCRATVAVVSVLVTAVTLSGCARDGSGGPGSSGAASSPGITDTTITLGITSPLSGSAAGVGNCAVDGAVAYFDAKNADGGITFGDGKQRKVEIKTYDDGYDPQRAAANYQQMRADGVFGGVLSLGTPTNRAWREAAIADQFPQVLVQTGDPIFSDPAQSPWQLGLLPIYQQEGKAFGELVRKSGSTHQVAVLYQNDDFGKGYVEGFKEAIAGASNVTIVKEAGFETTATDVNAQVTDLASTDADIFFNAMSSLAPLVVGSLKQASAIGWHPDVFLPSTSSSPALIAPSGVADTFAGIYTSSSSQSIASPAVQAGDDGKKFLDALHTYTRQTDVPAFPQCVWSWIGSSILEKAFSSMTEPNRDGFMTALRSISGFEAPFLLPGSTIDTTNSDLPAMSGVVIQKFTGNGYAPAEDFS